MFSSKFQPKLLEFASWSDFILYSLSLLSLYLSFLLSRGFLLLWDLLARWWVLSTSQWCFTVIFFLRFSQFYRYQISSLLYEFSLPNVAFLFHALKLFHHVDMVLPCICQWDLECLEMPQWFATSIRPYRNKNLYMENISASLMGILA